MSDHPRISILLAVFNAEQVLAETLDTVVSQSYKDWELIIQDGASKDSTVTIAEQYARKYENIKVFSEPDKGQGDAMEKAAQRARGDFIVYLCASDGYLDKNWFARCIDVLDKDHEVSLVWGIPFDMDERGTLLGPHYAYAHFLREPYSGPLKIDNKPLLNKLGERLTSRDAGSFSDIIKKINLFRLASFVHIFKREEPPQKMEWFKYWLKTGSMFPDGNMIIARSAFFDCMPHYEGEPTPDWMRFFYNFNAKGYLAACIPEPANFAKILPGHLGEAVAKFNLDTRNEYYSKIKLFKKQLDMSKFVFRDQRGNAIIKK